MCLVFLQNLIICHALIHCVNTIVNMINPLTTDDAIWCRLTLAACYQLAQSVLKIGFAIAKKRDRGRWVGSPRSAVHMAAALAG